MFKKAIAILTLLLASYGSVLSTYIIIDQKKSLEPSLYSAYTITAQSDKPATDNLKKVRFNFFISNTGKVGIDIPPSIKVQTFDSKNEVARELSARLIGINGEQLEANINDVLKVGEQRMYSTSYFKMDEIFRPYMNYLISLKSDDDVFLSLRTPPMAPEKLEKIFNSEDGIMLKYFGDLKVSPQKMILQQ